MGIALIFPGQASQTVGMGRDLYENFPRARERYDAASTYLDFDLRKISFEGPEEDLKQTAITQPAIFVHSYVMFELLQERGVRPDFVAGHSLGEYSALAASAAFSFEVGLQLVALRGRLMQNVGNEQPGTMAAIIGLDEEQVVQICEKAGDKGVVVPANYNSPGQIAVSGSLFGVRKAIELARRAGARKAIELEVSGAFHSPLMKAATQQMAQALADTEIHTPSCPIVANVTAAPTRNPDEIRTNLIKQLTHPVRWIESMETILGSGIRTFYEVGPGKVLTGLLKRIDRSATCTPIRTVPDLEKIA